METVESLATRFSSFKMLLVGDYNITGLYWPTDRIFSYDASNAANRKIIDKAILLGNSFGTLDLMQLHPVLVPDKGYSLDLCFSKRKFTPR